MELSLLKRSKKIEQSRKGLPKKYGEFYERSIFHHVSSDRKLNEKFVKKQKKYGVEVPEIPYRDYLEWGLANYLSKIGQMKKDPSASEYDGNILKYQIWQRKNAVGNP